MTRHTTISGLPRFLLRDAQVLALVSVSFSLLGGILQEIHRVGGASGVEVVARQVTSNLLVSGGTIAASLAYLALGADGWSVREAWTAEKNRLS